MTTIEWREVSPEQDNWKRQINLIAYYGSWKLGSIILCDERDWSCVIDDNMDYMDAETEEAAKEELIMRLQECYEEKRDYYRELIDSLEELST